MTTRNPTPRVRRLGPVSAVGRSRSLSLALAALTSAACSTTNTFTDDYYFPLDAGIPKASEVPGPPPIIRVIQEGPPPAPAQGGSTSEPTPPGEPEEDAAAPPALDGSVGTPIDAGPEPLFPGAPIATVDGAELELDVFGQIANHYWFLVSPEQLDQLNGEYGYGGGPYYNGDIYSPGGGSNANYVDHLLVTPAGSEDSADFGKVQVKLVGESTGRPWTESSLPNLKLDADEFVEGNKIGGVKHFRFNNAVVGTIFREKLTFDLYARLGYPVPRANFAWVSSSVWDSSISVPYVVVESYKPQFCKLREDVLGGGCENMWEFPGEFAYQDLDYEGNCQFSECDASNANDFQTVLQETPSGEGYKAALEGWLDWDSFHQYQCLAWILGVGDDPIHNSGNNTVVAERTDGLFQYFPYSVDISLGQEWYSTVTLAGSGSVIASGCQSDPACWADTIAVCEDLIEDFTNLDPVGLLDEEYAALEDAGMLRSGDEGRYESLSNHMERRLEDLPGELELNRDAPYYPYGCEYPLVQCGDYCSYPEECQYCDDGNGGGGYAGGPVMMPDPRPIPLGVGGAAADIAFPVGGAGQAPPPGPDAGGGGNCVEYINIYGAPAEAL